MALGSLPQDVDTDENYGADGTPEVAGADFSANKTLSVSNNEDFGITGGASITQSTGDDNKGKVDFAGNSTIRGTVGVAGASIKEFNLNGRRNKTVRLEDDAFIQKTTVGRGTLDLNGNITGNKVEFNRDGTVTVKNNKNLNLDVKTDANKQGTLTFEGTSTTTGIVGERRQRLDALNGGADGEKVTFEKKVFARTITVTGTGKLKFNADVSGKTLNFAGDGTTTMADGKDIKRLDITTATKNTGTLTLKGETTVEGKVGTKAARLKEVKAGADGVKVTFEKKVFTQLFTVTGDGTVDLERDTTADRLNFTGGDGEVNLSAGRTLTGDITTSANNMGTFEANDGTTIAGDIGAVGARVKQVKSNDTAFNGDTYATTFVVNGGGNTATIAAGKNIFATNIDGESAGKGKLTFLGGITTQAKIGTNNQLRTLNLGNNVLAGGVFNMSHDFNVGTTNVNTGSTLNITGNRNVTGDLNLKNGSTLGLGSDTLMVSGTYKQRNNSTVNLNVDNSTTFGKVVAAGNAIVSTGSAVNVTVAPGEFIAGGTTFKVVDGALASGNVGLPGTITDDSTVLAFTGATDGDDLTLTANRVNTIDSRGSSGGNASEVGKALEGAGSTNPDSDMKMILGQLDVLTDEGLDKALNQLYPNASGADIYAVKAALNSFIGTIGGRLGGFHGSNGGNSGVSTGDMLEGVRVWAQGYGDHIDQDKRKGIDGYQANTFGTAFGFDKLLNPGFLVGGSFGFARVDINSKNTGKMETDVTSYQSSLYSSWTKNDWYVDGFMSFAHNEYDAERNIVFGGVNRTAKSEYNGQQYSWLLEGGYEFDVEGVKVTPIASLQYTFLQLHDYTETGAGSLNLSVDSERYHTIEQGLGLKVSDEFTWKSFAFQPAIRAMWYYDYMGERSQTTASLSGGGTSFDTRGADPAQHALNLGAELVVVNSKNWELAVNYETTLKDEFQSHAYFGTIRYEF